MRRALREMARRAIPDRTRSKSLTKAAFRAGQAVRWQWSGNTAAGKVVQRFERRVQRTIKGSRIVRNGSADDPAYLIEQGDGDRVLKLGSELTAS